MIYYRVGDTLPPLRILVRDAGQVVDLTNLDVKVRWQRGDGTVIAERDALVVDPINGVSEYNWQLTDLTVPGSYEAIVQLQPHASSARYSLTNPPIIEIEVLSNDFEEDANNFPLIPTPTASQVADILGIDVADLDGNHMRGMIQRARRAAFALTNMAACENVVFNDDQIALMNDLVALLAARDYVTQATVEYGPFRKETIGSYSYELKITQRATQYTPPWAKTGNPIIDSILQYFWELCLNAGPGIDINYPEWRRNIVYVDPGPYIYTDR